MGRGLARRLGVQSTAVSSKMRARTHLILRVNMSLLGGSGGLRAPQKIRIKGERLSDILAAHGNFVRGGDGGVRAGLGGADLSRADLGKANLMYADLQGANLEGANLREAKLGSADLSRANLKGADLRKADLTESHLNGADLTEAQAGGAEFFRARLAGAIVRRGDFVASNFRDADVHGANFDGALLRTAILRETKLDGVDLSRAEGLDTALMPRGYSPAGAAKS